MESKPYEGNVRAGSDAGSDISFFVHDNRMFAERAFYCYSVLDKSQRELKFCQNTSIIQSDSTQDNT